MRFVEKTEQSFIREIGIGSVIEYEIELLHPEEELVRYERYMIVGIGEGYGLLDIRSACIFGPIYVSLKSILDKFQSRKKFRIIKSKNLELREV